MANNVNVKYTRGDTAFIAGTTIQDGQILYNTVTGQHYEDVGSTRIEVGKIVDTTLSTTSTNAVANSAITGSIVNTTAGVLTETNDYVPCGTKPVKFITPQTKTIAWVTGYTPTSQLVYKTGNIVTIQIRYDATSIANAFQIGTVPSDCIPATSTGFTGIGLYQIGGIYKSCFLQVINTGAILIANNNAETMTYAGVIIQYSVA